MVDFTSPQDNKVHKSAISRDVAWWSSASFLGQLLGIATDLIISRFLGPSLRGAWETVRLILAYADYSNLGVRTAAGRDIPIYTGKQQHTDSENLKRSTFSFTMTTAVLLATFLLIATFLLPANTPAVLVWALRVAPLIIVLQQWLNFYNLIFRAEGRFDLLSKTHALRAILRIAVLGSLTILWGFTGLLLGFVLTQLILCIYVARQDLYKLVYRLDRNEIGPLLVKGFPFLVIGISELVFTTFDRVLIASFLSLQELGYYSIALTTLGILAFVPNVVTTVLYPRVYRDYGLHQTSEILAAYLTKPNRMISSALAIVMGNVVIVLPIIVNFVLPEYLPGVAAARIICAAAFFQGLSRMAGTVLLPKNTIWYYQVGLIINALINLVLVLAVLLLGWGIEGVALAIVLSNAVYFMTFNAYVFKNVSNGFQRFTRLLATVFPQGLWSAFALILVFSWFQDGYVGTLLKLFVFNLLMIPLLFHLLKESEGFNFLKKFKSRKLA